MGTIRRNKEAIKSLGSTHEMRLVDEGAKTERGMMGGLHVGRKYEPELSCVEMKLVSTKKKKLGMKSAEPWETSL